MSKRDDLRQRLFSAKKFRSKVVNLFGDKVEIRQPSVGQILKARDTDDSKEALIGILVDYCFVPGTTDRVFEKSDAGAIMEWPVGKWFTDVNTAITDLTDIDVAGSEKN